MKWWHPGEHEIIEITTDVGQGRNVDNFIIKMLKNKNRKIDVGQLQPIIFCETNWKIENVQNCEVKETDVGQLKYENGGEAFLKLNNQNVHMKIKHEVECEVYTNKIEGKANVGQFNIQIKSLNDGLWHCFPIISLNDG